MGGGAGGLHEGLSLCESHARGGSEWRGPSGGWVRLFVRMRGPSPPLPRGARHRELSNYSCGADGTGRMRNDSPTAPHLVPRGRRLRSYRDGLGRP
eukprot:scaffold3343_cov309-Prasinococcus_capsulatus_cf.AAC.2